MNTEIIAKQDLHKLVIDEYYANGFNKRKAVLKYCPHLSVSGAKTFYYVLSKIRENREYITDKITILRADTQIKAIHVLRELINFSFSNLADFMCMTEAEVKALPPDVTRCIESFEAKKTRYLPRGAKKGEEIEQSTIKIKLYDKIKAIEMINKHIGFYSADNKQRAVKIDLSKATNVQLNMLLNMVKEDI